MIGTLLLALSIASFPGQAVEIFFSPGPDCEKQIVSAIGAAKTDLLAAVYSINNPRIVAALVAAHKRGVKVRVLTDRTQAAGRSSRVLELVDAGVALKLHSKHKIEHNKFLVADGNVAINGSYNWTKPATEVNSENCAVMPEANAVAAYRARFEALWQLNSQTRSVASIKKLRQRAN